MDKTIRYNELSFLVWQIPKYNVLILDGEINAHVKKVENDESGLDNSSSSPGKNAVEFTFENKLVWLITKFQKRDIVIGI